MGSYRCVSWSLDASFLYSTCEVIWSREAGYIRLPVVAAGQRVLSSQEVHHTLHAVQRMELTVFQKVRSAKRFSHLAMGGLQHVRQLFSTLCMLKVATPH